MTGASASVICSGSRPWLLAWAPLSTVLDLHIALIQCAHEEQWAVALSFATAAGLITTENTMWMV